MKLWTSRRKTRFNLISITPLFRLWLGLYTQGPFWITGFQPVSFVCRYRSQVYAVLTSP